MCLREHYIPIVFVPVSCFSYCYDDARGFLRGTCMQFYTILELCVYAPVPGLSWIARLADHELASFMVKAVS